MKSIILFLFSFLCLCHLLLQQGHRKVLWLNSSFSGFLGFPDSSVGKESACNAEDPGSIPGLRRSAGEGKVYTLQYSWTSLVAQLVKNPPAMQETRVPSLGWEDPLEKGKAAHSSILAWSPWNSIDCIVHGVTKSWARLIHFHFQWIASHDFSALFHLALSSSTHIQTSEILVISVSTIYPTISSFIFLHLHCCHLISITFVSQSSNLLFDVFGSLWSILYKAMYCNL